MGKKNGDQSSLIGSIYIVGSMRKLLLIVKSNWKELIIAFFMVFTSYELIQIRSEINDMRFIAGNVHSIKNNVSSIESDVSTIEWDVSTIERSIRFK